MSDEELNSKDIYEDMEGYPSIGTYVSILKPFDSKDPTFSKNTRSLNGEVIGYKVEKILTTSVLIMVRIKNKDGHKVHLMWKDEITELLI